jgi:protoporphyrin/coproporphyrin ferrochelatase
LNAKIINYYSRRPRIAVVLLQLGGPDSLAVVRPYLTSFFSDPAILGLPQPFRRLAAAGIAARRAPIARKIYRHLGGRSPLLEETERQRAALAAALAGAGAFRCFLAMRYWHPLADQVARDVAAWGPDEITLLPFYPQFSMAASGSAIDDWQRAARNAGLTAPVAVIREYPTDPRHGFCKVPEGEFDFLTVSTTGMAA